MFRFGKFLLNSAKLCKESARLACPNFAQFSKRSMETFASNWENDLGNALQKAKEFEKPVMLVIYRPWCNYCQYLSRQIAASESLKQMEPFFVMTQVNEDETYLDNKYAPDNGVRYVPRVLFLTPEGEIMKDVRNHKSYKNGTLYVYNEVNEIMKSMDEVVKKHFHITPPPLAEKEEEEEESEDYEELDDRVIRDMERLKKPLEVNSITMNTVTYVR